MDLAAYNFTAQDAAGNILAGVSIEVRREVPGTPLVSLFSDVDGKTSLGNAFTSASGLGVFYVASGFYQIKTIKGSSTRTQRNVRIGTAGGYSIEEIIGFAVGISWKGDWQTSTAYNKTDVVENNGSAYICIAVHTSGSDDDEPGVGADWQTYWNLFTEKGAQGPPGNDGADGAVGTQGIQGVQGDPGATGAKGAQGDQGDTGAQGPPGLNWQGAWAAVIGYAVDDAVENNGSSYICIVPHGSIAQNEPGVGVQWESFWEVLAKKGATGATGGVVSVAGKKGVVVLTAADIASGTFADARIAQSNVTQHQGALQIGFGNITGKPTTLAGYGIADAEPLGEVSGINTQNGTSYILDLTDKGQIVEMNNAVANTVEVPPESSVAFPVKSRVDLVQVGAGQTTIVPGAGVTINSKDGNLKLAAQHSGAILYKRGADEWGLIGDLAA